MKRDLELVRQLLLDIESVKSGVPFQLTSDPGEDNHDEIQYHLRLMHQAGLIEGRNISTLDGSNFSISGLTWKGHDFLDASRNEKVWKSANEMAVQKGSQLRSLPFEIAKELLIEASKKLFGLG